MKAIIFAGGAGTRMWPLSRKKIPKQFEPMIDGKSTMQLQIEVISTQYKPEDIYISTGKEYVELARKQLPMIPPQNIIGEPCRRDVGAAVGFIFALFAKKFPNEPTLLLWSDHWIKQQDKFRSTIAMCRDVIANDNEKILFIGHKPRFASENLGWLEYGQAVSLEGVSDMYSFQGFKYKPDTATAQHFFTSGHHAWNLGYFMTTPAFMNGLFKMYAPEIHDITSRIASAYETPEFEAVLHEEYPKLPTIHVDHAIFEKMNPSQAYVMSIDVGWADIGAWEALKDALEESPQANITHGNVYQEEVTDTILYNYEADKLIVGLDVEGLVIVNTPDALLVTRKSAAPKISKLVKNLEATGHENLT